MNDIVSIFPTADEIRNEGIENFSLYLFEEELKSVFRLIIWAKSRNLTKVQATELSNECIDFLINKGYKIENDKNLTTTYIEWGKLV